MATADSAGDVRVVGTDWQRQTALRLLPLRFYLRQSLLLWLYHVPNCKLYCPYPYKGTVNNTICKDRYKDSFIKLLRDLFAMCIVHAVLSDAVIGADFLELLYGSSRCLCWPLLR